MKHKDSFILLFVQLSFSLTAASKVVSVYPRCDEDLFQCDLEISPGEWCISRSWVCDGEQDCPGGIDEKKNCPPPTCQPGKTRCDDGKHCIPKGWLCDGEFDCIDHSDESPSKCNNNTFSCLPFQYQCDGTNTCIGYHQLCDGQPDCQDSSDEGYHCRSSQCDGVSCPTQSHCVPTYAGTHACVCDSKGFYLNNDVCTDIDECESTRYCDQICTNSLGSYKCSCVDGYTLDSDGKTCLGKNVPPEEPTYIIYAASGTSQNSEIRQILENGSNVQVLNSSVTRITALDFDYSNRSFCYVTNDTMNCNKLNTSENWQVHFTYNLESVAHMAWDWLSSNWYFADESHERIFVCSSNGDHCVTLLTTGLKSVKTIVVDPLNGFLFFSTLNEPKIERTALDGSERISLIHTNQVVRPQALTPDYANKHLYWADAYLEKIERISYDGNGRIINVVNSLLVEKIVGLDMFQNHIYMSCLKNNTILKLAKYYGDEEPSTIQQNPLGPYLLKVVHRQRQPLPRSRSMPCQTTKCDHICLTMYREDGKAYAKCICEAGMKVDPQNATKCISAQTDRFLIYSNAKLGEMKGISLDAPPIYPIEVMAPITGLERPIAIDYHAKEEFIYYSDTSQMRIGRIKVDGTQRNDDFIKSGVSNCEGIAIDWIGYNIFWTDERMKSISVAKISDPQQKKTLIRDELSHPRAIVVDPRVGHGKMYWTDWVQKPSNVKAKIEMANMDGSGRKVLIDSTIRWPNGLTFDDVDNILYWCDAFTDRIEGYDLQKHIRIRIATGHKVKHPYGLVHVRINDQLHFYWTEFTDGFIKRFKNGTDEVITVRNESIPLFEIRLYDNSKTRYQSGRNPCAIKTDHNCSHLCLMNEVSHVCACPDGQFLEQGGKTCRNNGTTSNLDGCEDGEFKCKNGRCINTRWLCDGDNDCGDNSDEDKSAPVSTNDQAGPCFDKKCPDEDSMYMCSNNRCIYKRWMCDGEDDCRNGEDEDTHTCQAEECSGRANMTRCPNPPRCIPQSWFCDYDDDCGDGFDEQNCDYASCREDQFTCANSRCISYEYVCDGDNDCRDNSDEMNCGPIHGCNMTHELCNGSLQCVDKKLWCDGTPNCENGADESDCENYNLCKQDDMTKCENGRCVPANKTCDGNNDCGDNSDEMHCSGSGPITCGPKDFKCEGENPEDNHCIPNHWLCDKDNDCADGADEKLPMCNQTTVECRYPDQLCKDNVTCVKYTHLCDGIQHCPDNSDEETPDNFFCGMDLCRFAPCSHECHKSSFSPGYVCLCPPGKRLGPDKYNCTEVSPCQQWGVCSQNCEEIGNTENYYYSYQCTCNEGYLLDKDGFTCSPIDKTKAFIIFSNRHEIRRFELESNVTSYISLVAGLKNTIALDYYYNHSSPYGDSSLVFWTDVVDDKIFRGTLISNSVTSIKAIVNIGLATTEGLAVDWVTQHIYWVESNLDQIEVADFEGDMRATLIAGGMASPRAIVVDPKSGWLFWTDWDPSYPRIEKVTMVGKQRQIIVNVSNIEGGGWPNGLTADFETQRIYWIDARSDSVHTTKYDGSDHHLILKRHDFLSHPFAITTFGNYIYWTDWRSNALVRANKWTGRNVTMIQRTVTQPFDLQVFHPLRQPRVSNPCARSHGVCGEKAICLLGANAKADCICPHLHVPHVKDRITHCRLDTDFLLLAEKKKIRGLQLANLTRNVMPTLTTPFVYNPLAIDYDYKERKLYWTDDDGLHRPSDIHQHEYRGVIRANLNGTDVETVIDSSIPNPHGFAIDWISRNIYFTSYASNTPGTISVARLDGVHRSVILEEADGSSVVINATTSLVLDPNKGIMFWANAAPNNGSIWRANMDGSGPLQIYPNDRYDVEINNPASLVIFDNRLWWVNRDAVSDLVVNSDLEGNDPKVFFSAQNDTFRPRTIAVRNAVIVAANESAICSIDRQTLNMTHIGVSKSPVTSLKFFYESQTGGANQCSDNNGDCEHLCLATPSGLTCKCTDGYKLRGGRFCRGMDEFLMYTAKQLILGISLDSSDESTKALAPISRISQADAIDFYADSNDHNKDWIYWADSHLGHVTNQISRIRRDLSERDVLVSSGVMKIEGIAVDWVTKNIYWTDSLRKVIEVAQMNGSNRYVIISENLTDPRAVVVSPNKGMLYWSDLSSRDTASKIEQARLDGSERKIIVGTNITKPLGLALDYDNDQLYWCDQSKNIIEKVDLKTFTRQIIISNISDCQGLAFYQDYLYWTDAGQGLIARIQTDGTGYEIVRKGLVGSVKDIKIFNRELKVDDRQNLCAQDNGDCEELCFYLGDSRKRCQCAHARVVEGNKCVEFDSFIAFSRVTAIETVHMNEDIASSHNAPYEKIELADNMRNVIGVTFDYKEKRYFFSDIQQGNIQSVFFNGSDVKQVVRDVGSAEGLAFDSVYKDLYWTSYTNSSISRIRVYRKSARPEKIVQLGTKDHPRAIVIDGCNSKMYWTNWNDHKPSIQRAYMNGWDVQDVITTEIKTPNALTIDHKAAKLYWADARLDKIERCEFDGSNRVKILTSIPQHIFGMTLYGDYLYWTDWILRGVMRVSKYGQEGIVWLKKGIPRQPMGIVAVANDTDNCLANACNFNNGGCEQNCISHANSTVECGCDDNLQLAPNGKDCVGNCDASLEFSCLNGDCISYEFICDGRPHCGDESDERPDICEKRVCPDAFFPCWNKRCVAKEKHCNHINDCGDNSDEKDCSCRQEEFQCVSTGACIQLRYRCDYDQDCPDASDEMGCNKTDCSYFNKEGRNDFIRCNSTTACILPSWRCDGHNDCWDNEDEAQCSNDTDHGPKTCAEGWFECRSTSECIPHHWVCDSDNDCPRGEDEANCTYVCDGNKFMCDNTTCIPNSWKCDGHYDCSDQTDEVNCESHPCHGNEFSCNQTGQGQCIPKTWVCDGDKDCQNGEDEQITAAGCDPVPCTPQEVQCLNFQCIPKNFTCDGDDDCGDNSDERNCTYISCDPQVEFQCDHHHQCIRKTMVCDGLIDCKDGSDERDCHKPTPCANATDFMCNNGVCIERSRVCDKAFDCIDRSDENLCNINECDLKMDNCGGHPCQDLQIGYTCNCTTGFKLTNDSKSCVDIDECSSYPCSHYCLNTVGSYRCICADGYQLGNDKKTCKVVDTTYAPVLLVSNRYYIRNVTIDGNHTVLVAMNLTNAVALDYDWQERRIYWSDVTSISSRIMRMKETGDDVEVLHNTTLRNPDGIAVDWVGRNLYWCDKTTDTIEVSKLNGLYRKILVKEGLQEPRAIAVHPYKGWLFYTDWGDSAHIGKLGMDGSERKHVISEKLGWPNALTIDYITGHIIWADARLDYIATADLDGKNMRYILKDSQLPHIFAITQFEDYVFWTDWENKSVERARKSDGKQRKTLSQMVHRPMDINLYHPYRQRPVKKNWVNPCEDNGGCGNGTLCLLKPGGTDRICACPEHHYLSEDKKHCIANCSTSEFLCAQSYKCVPFWWKCDGQQDCPDGSDEPEDCPTYHCRRPGLYQCANATGSYHCISPIQICDGVQQCINGSDEVKCETYTCLESQFKCHDPPRCIPLTHRCNGVTECEDSSDEKNCPTRTCAANHFQCDNKRCVPYVWKCDNDNDCGDKSDERENCTQTVCKSGYLKCKSGRCIPQSWKCDGDRDCGPDDDSDEPKEECDKVECEGTYFKCANNRCIPGRWRCDYDDDCRDGSDEDNCTARACTESEFRCSDQRCILKLFRCDGHPQCDDRSDELDCNKTLGCLDNEFTCGNSSYCIPKQWQCDGEPDCADLSDEQNCKGRCSSDEFMCRHGTACVPQTWICDGNQDCSDSSDEQHCDLHLCLPGYFRCKNHRCIPYHDVCNEVNNCGDNTDEAHCGNKTCAPNEFQCRDSGQCIKMELLCDDYRDCADGSDEGLICREMGPCDQHDNCTMHQECKKLGNSSMSRCFCKEGYMQDPDGCTDIDECRQFGSCQQRCWNLDGKKKCSCEPGFKRHNYTAKNIEICAAEGEDPLLLIATRNEIISAQIKLKYYDQTNAVTHQILPVLEGVKIGGMDVYQGSGEITVFVTNHERNGSSIFSFKHRTNKTPSNRVKRQSGPDKSTQKLNLTHGEIKTPVDIAVDWVSKRLYWTDSGTRMIMSSDFNGSRPMTIAKVNLHKPQAIVVDPESRYVFWSDTGIGAKIERATLDGTERQTLVSERIEWPTGLAMDYPNRRLYWADARRRTIESITLDGRNRHLVYQFPSGPANTDSEAPYKLDVFESFLYITTYNTHNIIQLDKFSNSSKITQDKGIVLFSDLVRVSHLVISQQYKQRNMSSDFGLNPCHDNKCSQYQGSLCINVPRGNYRCPCPDGFSKNTSSSCSPVPDVQDPCYNYCEHNHTENCSMTEHGTAKCSCTTGFKGPKCEIDLCKGFCNNGGTCNVKENKPQCTCPKQFHGPRCETNKCSGYCHNKGYCQHKSTGPACKCPQGFTGAKCEKQASENKCEDFKCHNSGKCYFDNKGRPTCACPQPYSGDHCQNCTFLCPAGQSCPEQDCKGHGYCSIVNDVARCNCDEGYVAQCAHVPTYAMHMCVDGCVDVCHNYCLHNNTCSVKNGQADCDCQKPWSGPRCETNLCNRRCAHGDCNPQTLNCTCNNGWTGDRCDKPVSDKCHCKNGGTCLENGACQCALGYTGETCSEEIGCQIVRCYHGGSCIKLEDYYYCRCAAGYMGDSCQKKMPQECISFCKNGGICDKCKTSPVHECKSCRCTVEFHGHRCTERFEDYSAKKGGSDVVLVAVPLVVCFLIVLLILGICYFRRRNNGQFKHKRMTEPGNVEISNPIYMRDYEDDEGGDIADGFSFDPDKPTNFTNPMYDTLYNENTLQSPDNEKNPLVNDDKMAANFYADEERQPLGHSSRA